MQYNRNVNLPQVHVSRVNMAYISCQLKTKDDYVLKLLKKNVVLPTC